MSPRESVSWKPKHISSESIWYPIVTSSIHTARRTSCVLISEYSIRQDKTLKGKDSIYHNKSIEGRNIIWSDYINKAHDIDHEREIKHIATGTNPHPRGWTTPSSSWWPPAWWRWPPLMISPSGGVPEWGLDWFLVATEAYGGGTSDLGLPRGFLEYLGIYRAKRRCRWAMWGAQPPGRAQVGCSPHRPPLWCFVGPYGVFWTRKNLQKVLLHLDSVWYGYSVK